jgi:type II secretion system protein G
MLNNQIKLFSALIGQVGEKKRGAFTLIELLVVVVIIGILASVALPNFINAQDKAKNSAVAQNITTVKMGLEQFATDNSGAYPVDTKLADTATGIGLGQAGKGYLAGDKLPISPWAKVVQSDTDVPAYTGAVIAGGTAGAAAGNPLNTLGHVINAAGEAKNTVAAPPNDTKDYGYISYSYDTGSQVYVLYGTGKDKSSAVVAAGVSNNGLISKQP